MAVNNAINSSGLQGVTSKGTDGQLLVASTAGVPSFASLTTQTLNQTGAANSLTLNVIRLSTGESGWTQGQTTGNITPNGAYIVTTAAQTLTLPASPVQGDVFYIFTQGLGTAVLNFLTNIGSGQFVFNGSALVSNPTLAVFSSCIIVCTQGGINPIYQVLGVNGTLV